MSKVRKLPEAWTAAQRRHHADQELERALREAPAKIERVLVVARKVCRQPVDLPEEDDLDAETASLRNLLTRCAAGEMTLVARKPTGTPSYWREAHSLANLWRIYKRRHASEHTALVADVPEPEPPAKVGFIYIIRAGDRVKIGFATNVEARLSSLRGSSPLPIVLLHTMRGTMAAERALHKRFAAYRLHGEWFTPEGTLADYIADFGK